MLEGFTNPSALHLFTPDGRLGTLSNERRFQIDEALTAALGDNLARLLAHARDRAGPPARLGLLFHSVEPRAWQSDSLLYEEAVVRALYPVGGRIADGLTAFQAKNREKSVFQGLELLLNYRAEGLPDVPVYCPLLCARRQPLALYAEALNLTLSAEQGASPALEVYNLYAAMPAARRQSPEALAVLEHARRGLAARHGRAQRDFTLIDRVAEGAMRANDGQFFDVDRRDDRAVTTPMSIGQIELLYGADRIEDVDRWLERPHRPVDPALLRTFVQFRGLEHDMLVLLAKRALVHTAPANVRLLQQGMSDAWNLYLLEGTLSLDAEDGQSLIVGAGTPRAESPVAFLKPRKYTVATLTPVSFLWIHDALLRFVLKAGAREPISSKKP